MRAGTAARSHGAITLQEWGDLGEDVEGELVDGQLEEEEVPTFLHEVVAAALFALLRAWAKRRGGIVTGAETKIAVGARRGRKPDVSVFLDAWPEAGDSVARVSPHLVVEVVSPRPRDARRDRVDKLRDYARAGVRHYWIVDPQVRTLEVYELGPRGRYEHALAADSGRVRRVPGCVGLVIDLDALWREADALATRPSRRRAPTRKL